MKNANNLRTNERVEFEIEDEIYKSSVQDIISDSSIAVSIPLSGAKSYLPIQGEKVEFFIFHENQYHKYKGVLSSRAKEGDLRFLVIEDLKYIGKIQRRENFRIHVSLEVSYLKISKEVAEKGVSEKVYNLLADKFIPARSVDVSAGGIRIFAQEKIEVGTFMMLKIKFNSAEEVCVMSQVIRDEIDSEIKAHKLGCKFIDLQVLEEEKIIKYIFEKSRELMKR